MKPSKDVKRLIRKRRYDADSNVRTRVLNNVLGAFNEAKAQAASNLSIRTKTRNRRITKLAVAAMVTVGIISSITLFDGLLSPTFALDDVWAAVAKAEWVHMTWQYADHDIESGGVTNQAVEGWTSVRPPRTTQIYRDNSVSFTAYDEVAGVSNTQNYSAQTQVVTSIFRYEKSHQYSTIVDAFLGEISELEKKGATVEYSDDVYHGNPVKVIKVDFTDDSGVRIQGSVTADANTYLPINATSSYEESGKSRTENVVFDYPETGPTDIYQAGVPRDAEIRVVDYRPSPEFLEAIKPYRAARENLPQPRIVVEISNELGHGSLVSLVYTKGGKERFEQLRYASLDTDDLKAIPAWTRGVKKGELDVQLNDGTMVYCVKRDSLGRWTRKTKSPSQYKSGLVVSGLLDRGWPRIKLGRPVQNSDAGEKGLLCIETMHRPMFTGDSKLAESAEKTRYYLDPKHDYLCVYMERFRHPVPPPWGNPKVSKIDFDCYDIPDEPYLIKEVEELDRTETGHWYPNRIKITDKQSWTDKGSGWEMREKTINVRLYVDSNPEFSDGILSPGQLPDTNE